MKYVIEKKTNNEWECLGEYNDKEQAITAMNIMANKSMKSLFIVCEKRPIVAAFGFTTGPVKMINKLAKGVLLK